jgi:hypothetical protein
MVSLLMGFQVYLLVIQICYCSSKIAPPPPGHTLIEPTRSKLDWLVNSVLERSLIEVAVVISTIVTLFALCRLTHNVSLYFVNIVLKNVSFVSYGSLLVIISCTNVVCNESFLRRWSLTEASHRTEEDEQKLYLTVLYSGDISSCSLLKVSQYIRIIYHLHFRNRRIRQIRNQLETSACYLLSRLFLACLVLQF